MNILKAETPPLTTTWVKWLLFEHSWCAVYHQRLLLRFGGPEGEALKKSFDQAFKGGPYSTLANWRATAINMGHRTFVTAKNMIDSLTWMCIHPCSNCVRTDFFWSVWKHGLAVQESLCLHNCRMKVITQKTYSIHCYLLKKHERSMTLFISTQNKRTLKITTSAVWTAAIDIAHIPYDKRSHGNNEITMHG